MIKLTTILLIILIPVYGYCTSLEMRIKKHYKDIVQEIQKHGIRGPISPELAQYALLRQLHEDGMNRPIDICMNGMVPGNPNDKVIKKLRMPGHELSKVTANDGQGCYVIKGPRANVMGATVIALWYDMMINHEDFRICSEEERKIWNDSRWYSEMIARDIRKKYHTQKFNQLQKEREKVLQKANSAYGPQGPTINKDRDRLIHIFNGTGIFW